MCLGHVLEQTGMFHQGVSNFLDNWVCLSQQPDVSEQQRCQPHLHTSLEIPLLLSSSLLSFLEVLLIEMHLVLLNKSVVISGELAEEIQFVKFLRGKFK